MYSETLEAIIEAALADGEITEKERAVLHKRAIAEGIDPDELDVVIDGRLAKMQKVERDWLRPMAPPIPQETPKSDKHGIVNKCPRCGKVVEAAEIKCSACGYAFRGIEAIDSVKTFSEGLNNIEQRNSSRGTMANLAGTFLSALGSDSRTNEIKTYIANFPVPTSKEDLIEFIMFLKPKSEIPSKFNSSRTEQDIAKAYKKKYVECYEKAKLYFSDDPLFKKIEEEKSKSRFGKLFGK